MKTILILLCIAILSCKPNSEAGNIQHPSENSASTEQINNDTLAMIQSVKGFLTWYKENYSKANSFGFTYMDKQGNYNVSVAQGEEYLNFLKSSGYISDTYVSLWLQYFKDKAAYLEENLQNEGPPEGFEFDLVLITQEPELLLNEIHNLQFAVGENNGTKALLQMAGDWGYEIEMVKENDKWLIVYISTLNYD
ncbi:MAG: hypothetical protein IPM42_14545 [Saprospiraceae bacterium]|nr:hypothetical protein [Saprospiraceae bacterium]